MTVACTGIVAMEKDVDKFEIYFGGRTNGT